MIFLRAYYSIMIDYIGLLIRCVLCHLLRWIKPICWCSWNYRDCTLYRDTQLGGYITICRRRVLCRRRGNTTLPIFHAGKNQQKRKERKGIDDLSSAAIYIHYTRAVTKVMHTTRYVTASSSLFAGFSISRRKDGRRPGHTHFARRLLGLRNNSSKGHHKIGQPTIKKGSIRAGLYLLNCKT